MPEPGRRDLVALGREEEGGAGRHRSGGRRPGARESRSGRRAAYGRLAVVNRYQRLLRDLDRAGLWREIPAEVRRTVVRRLNSFMDAVWWRGGAWAADGEDLADGEVEDWLRGMVVPLGDCGVVLDVGTPDSPWDDVPPPGYTVTVNGTALALYSTDAADPRRPLSDDPWMDCTLMPAAEVNRLLRAAGSDRRIVLFWPGGNDGLAVLGPEDMLRRVGAATAASRGEVVFAVP